MRTLVSIARQRLVVFTLQVWEEMSAGLSGRVAGLRLYILGVERFEVVVHGTAVWHGQLVRLFYFSGYNGT